MGSHKDNKRSVCETPQVLVVHKCGLLILNDKTAILLCADAHTGGAQSAFAVLLPGVRSNNQDQGPDQPSAWHTHLTGGAQLHLPPDEQLHMADGGLARHTYVTPL